MTVREYLSDCKVDDLFIDEFMPSTSYWQTCIKFLHDIEDKEMAELTSRQEQWLDKIVTSCREMQEKLEE